MAPPQNRQCFISCASRDINYVKNTMPYLECETIKFVIFDTAFYLGRDLYSEIAEQIESSDKILFYCSKNSLSSWWVGCEIRLAYEKERQIMLNTGTEKLVILPIDLDGSIFKNGIPAWAIHLRSRIIANFTGWPKDKKSFLGECQKLKKAITDHSCPQSLSDA